MYKIPSWQVVWPCKHGGRFGVSMLKYNPGVMPSSSQPLNECSVKRFLLEGHWATWKKKWGYANAGKGILRLETTRQLIITYYLLYTLRFTSTLYVCAADSCIAADIQQWVHCIQRAPSPALASFHFLCVFSILQSEGVPFSYLL